MLLRSVTSTMGDDMPDNVAEVGVVRMANQLARKVVVMNTKKKKTIKDDELIDVPPVEEKKKSKIKSINRRTARLMTLVRS